MEKRADLAPEEIGDGLRHDIQGQWIAHVRFDEACLLLWGADQLVLGQQLLAGRGLQADQAQHAHRAAAALQRPQLSGFLPAGEQQAARVPRFAHPPQ